MKNKKLIIIGLSNNAKLAAYYFENDSEYTVVGFAVSTAYKTDEIFYDLPVFELERLEYNYPPSNFDVFVAIGYKGMNKIREFLYNLVKNKGYFLPNYISSKCTFLTEEIIGDNNFILEDNTIQPFVKIGSNNVLWSGNHIGHDVEIGNHNFIASHVVISGFTRIKNNCFIGVNATIRDGIELANKTLVAAAAVIMKNTKEEEVHLAPKSVLIDKKSVDLEIS
jgi:sugar O-acyltransferase (sialic acid O-acetyltransferase NeuD family)